MDLALASFHKYGQRKQQQEAVGGFPVGLVLLRTPFKPGISLWATKAEVYISVTHTAYTGMAHRHPCITQVNTKELVLGP